jgi:hypothetical protein
MRTALWFALNDDRPLVGVRWHLDRVQGRPWLQVEADIGAASGLRYGTECRGPADPSEGHAGDPDHGGRVRRMDARALG